MPVTKQLVTDRPAARPAAAPPPAPRQAEPLGVAPAETPEPLTGGVVVPAEEFKFTAGSGLAVFAGMPGLDQPDQMPEPEGGGSGPYAAFASERSPSWASLKLAGINDGDPYVSADGQYLKATPLKFFLVSAAPVFFTKRNTAGNIVAVKREQVFVNDKGQFDEHYLTLIIADVDGRLIPAKAEFVGTKSGAVVPALRAVRQAGTPEWGTVSPAHKLTLACPYPFARVSCMATASRRISKTSGNPYYAGGGSARPATLEEMKRLSEALADTGFQALAGAAKEGFQDKLALLEKMAGWTER